jgi:small subunit ribosomal protein S7
MRRAKPEKRDILPDIRFSSVNLQTLIQHVLKRGKKSTAVGLVYDAMDIIKERTEKSPLEVFDSALKNVSPAMEVRPRRVGGATYQVPMEVPSDRQFALAMRWLVGLAGKRKGTPMKVALAAEVMDAYQGQGNAIRKRDEVHKMAQANKAFAHFRW